MLWPKKPAPITPARSRLLGLALTASRARAVVADGGPARSLGDDLPLAVRLDGRGPDVGRAAVSLVRKAPHLVCTAFLPHLGVLREWRGPRFTLTPESALAAVFEALRPTLLAEADTLAVALPSYLTATQVNSLYAIAGNAKLPLRGSAVAALAIAAHRSSILLAPPSRRATLDDGRPEWVVPMHPPEAGPGTVVVVDVDDYALTATAVQVTREETRRIGSSTLPRAAGKLWTDRLIDAMSDRCVRLCRRDPRDSADAEQDLYEQLDSALDRVRTGATIVLTVRADKWYQDLTLTGADLDGYCAPLAKLAAEGVRELVAAVNLPGPPRAIWLTQSAALLPGLASAIYQQSPERTDVAVLPADAAAEAAAALLARWITGELPAGHLDDVVPVQKSAAESRSAGHLLRS